MPAIYLYLLPILATVLLLKFWLAWPSSEIRYIQCDVGQGDAILLIQGFAQVLVDSGRGHNVLSCLDTYIPFWDRTLELMVATHADLDHIGGVDEVMKHYQIGRLIYNGETDELAQWQQLVEQLHSQKGVLTMVQAGDQLQVGAMQLHVLWPDWRLRSSLLSQQDGHNQNDESLVLRLRSQSLSALLTGDISSEVEAVLVDRGGLNSDILKVAHHGSRFSSSLSFLRAVAPRMATIGVGPNQYGHPNDVIVDRLKSLDIETQRTDTKGSILIDLNKSLF